MWSHVICHGPMWSDVICRGLIWSELTCSTLPGCAAGVPDAHPQEARLRELRSLRQPSPAGAHQHAALAPDPLVSPELEAVEGTEAEEEAFVVSPRGGLPRGNPPLPLCLLASQASALVALVSF